ncbi:hypothetical protein B6D60_08110 [candidate division KSB1 bacterium 4484_87]|nr:MAG: hypothetical protein B6D60_08110 [candidate division KSB1 bacterium 4484_87]
MPTALKFWSQTFYYKHFAPNGALIGFIFYFALSELFRIDVITHFSSAMHWANIFHSFGVISFFEPYQYGKLTPTGSDILALGNAL